jgi:hypothetical protein
MQQQVEGFTATQTQELSKGAVNRPAAATNTLMPVIQMNSMMASRPEGKRTPEGKRRARWVPARSG